MDDTHERTVQRELIFSNGHSLTIFEDGNFSIARHIWDAGLVFSQALVAVITSSHKGLGSIKEVLSQCEDGIIQIIELGSGCGLVGLATAWHLPRCSVLLTDLEDAREMVLKNLAANPPPNPSAVDFRVLEWGEPLPEKLAKAAFDLVLITDCTYNPDSAAALVSTISGLTASNPRCLIVVAMKIRHQSEEIFFQLIDEARLVEVQKQSFPSPHLGDLEEGEIIEVHCYRLRPDV
ncbi:MAG: hypothetical protein M1814_004554 [Vezdaea aestivalis]|nr:MAG: hypothetical protein M1814_004554 [Vezdaea aestivalis]